MRYLAYLVMAVSLASCVVVQQLPIIGYALSAKGDTRPFEQPLPVNTKPKRLALGYDFKIDLFSDSDPNKK